MKKHYVVYMDDGDAFKVLINVTGWVRIASLMANGEYFTILNDGYVASYRCNSFKIFSGRCASMAEYFPFSPIVSIFPT